MKILDADEISRVALLHLADGSAHSLEDAEHLVSNRQLIICPAPATITTAEGQAAVLTAAATGVRTFGSVLVDLPGDADVHDGVHRGRLLSDALSDIGATLGSSAHSPNVTAIVFGFDPADVPAISAGVILHASWDGWTAIVSPHAEPVNSCGNVLAAVAAAALAVAEAFAHSRAISGSDAGYRKMELNLLGPTARSAPELRFAPAAWWLVGLGHLGQAYAWVLSHIPYADRASVEVTVQDVDRTAPANHSTSVLTPHGSKGELKTRLVAARLEDAGFRTRIIERRLDADFHVRDDETHIVALVGVDNLTARRALSAVGWSLTIDMGLGARAHDHTSISMHRFPGSNTSENVLAWLDRGDAVIAVPSTPGFDHLSRNFDDCGVVTLAGKAIGIPFVGVIAATLAVAEAVKQFHGVPGAEVASIDVATGRHVSAPAIRHPRIAQATLRQSSSAVRT
ncbi:hypothetical protein OSC27_14180 [Microbacterium sp. STN6]|uniref:hypothetical protein n=1 Tax=Microbacterium sp. STN6 TaxID=2995588 RepID=UPI002260AD5C|nr:hypothetical protein [Microbacterium sp. STN6]MCX7523419.1 hypothetical protein [Microbacterium sp. STN6]